MAKKTTKSKSKSNTKRAANFANEQAQTAFGYAKEQTRNASQAANDFNSFAQNFTKPNPFFNFKAFPAFQPAHFQQLMEQVIETSQKNMEAVTACTQLYVERTKNLLEEQASFTNRMMQETTSTVQDALSQNTSNNPRDKMDDMTDLAKYCLEKTTSHARKTAEENLEVCHKIGSALSKRLSASVDELRSAA